MPWRDIDRGEAESIVLAIELEADLILLDEKEGWHAAQRLGLKMVGVVGILLEAKKKGFVDSVRPHLDALRQVAGFYLKKSLYRYVHVGSPLFFKTLIKTVKLKLKKIDHYGIKIKSFDFSIAPPDSEMGRGKTTIITHSLE